VSHGRRGLGSLVLAVAVAVALAGCGAGSKRTALDVSAAASLRAAFGEYAKTLAGIQPRYSFAGSDALAAQIEQGVKPDLFASANTKLPDALFAKGLLEKPAVFAANKLVIAVPRSSKLTGIAGLERAGETISIGSAGVPVGAYTQKVLARLAPGARRALLANVRDRESDVTGIVGKLSERAVDAGFLYATDVKAAGGALRAIQLPATLQPQVAYAAAVVKGSGHAAQARAFITGLLGGSGRADLLKAGFLPPPAG
jgi:molybdate transport system substrate-binding protein